MKEGYKTAPVKVQFKEALKFWTNRLSENCLQHF
jgi:hypothetical protein